jgi:hypothetical protein
VLTGTGTAGAYHAGVLRALREAGVRVDLVAGRGMGAASALFAAADADGRLWDAQGLWTHVERPGRLYGWRLPWRVLAGGVGVAFALLALPAVLALALAAVYPLVYLALLLVPSWGDAAAAAYAAAVGWLLSPAVLLGVVPRAVTASLLASLGALLAAVGFGWLRVRGRKGSGGPWWAGLGAPMDAGAPAAWVREGFWRYLRGVANVPEPSAEELGQRYVELLRENAGQPGYRELLLVAHDVDARRDLVFAMLAEGWRAPLLDGAPGDAGRSREVVDLAGAGGRHVVDALAGALAASPACEPASIAFSPEGPWRGETHRLVDRPAALGRLLEECLRAGVRQVILVAAEAAGGGPHMLRRRRVDPRSRLGEVIAAEESSAVRDVLATHAFHFDGCFLVRPDHNPLGAFDFAGNYDERSDRTFLVPELVARGYEDAHRQFIDPVVGASGESLGAGVAPAPPAAVSPGDVPLARG